MPAINNITRANKLNHFYLGFEKDNQEECSQILEGVNCNLHKEIILIDPDSVNRVFKSLHTNNTTGPNRMSPFILKSFSEELIAVWPQLFHLSVDIHSVPKV